MPHFDMLYRMMPSWDQIRKIYGRTKNGADMRKKTWDLYAPIYKRAMKADQQIYDFMYKRIPEMIRDKEVLELATGPGLLAKHVAPAARRMVARIAMMYTECERK